MYMYVYLDILDSLVFFFSIIDGGELFFLYTIILYILKRGICFFLNLLLLLFNKSLLVVLYVELFDLDHQ